MPLRLPFALLAASLLAVAGVAHGPTQDANLDDWCVHDAPRVEDRAATLRCDRGTEVVWWDAPADAAVNDLSVAATTSDASRLYWGIRLHNDPDPISLPMIEIAIDAGPGGDDSWWDPLGNLKVPGHCSVDTSRLCTVDADCHFCTISTIYSGTPDERPRVCGSTDALDSCDPFAPGDTCIRTQTCVGLAAAPPVPHVGAEASPALAPDYLLVFDLSRWLFALCDAVKLLREEAGAWVEIPRTSPDPYCTPPLPTWHFPILTGVIPPRPEHADLELAVPWEAFDCPGCVPLGPGDDFRWTVQLSRGLLNLDYRPDGPIEDVMSEGVAGTWTSTSDGCAVPGEPATLCEVADGSTDAFVSGTPQDAGGRVDGLTVRRNDTGFPNPSITLTWDPSCTNGDQDYGIYEGEIGDWYGHLGPASGAICSTGGTTEATFEAGFADHYYLVVPRDVVVEGSYGQDGSGAERPASTAPCVAQSVSVCPLGP